MDTKKAMRSILAGKVSVVMPKRARRVGPLRAQWEQKRTMRETAWLIARPLRRWRLFQWPISWARTAMISSGVMPCNRVSNRMILFVLPMPAK